MSAETTGGSNPESNRTVETDSGFVTTKQAARSLGISPRTVRWHIEQGNLEATVEGEGVQRTWLVSINSLQAFRNARQAAADMPHASRVHQYNSEIAPDITGSLADVPAAGITGNPIRDLADRLAEEAARAAEYRVRLELTEQAQSTLEKTLAEERQSREQAERERDKLAAELEALREAREAPVTASEEDVRGEKGAAAQEPSQRRSWLHRFFIGPS
jgi:Helix-turn-helix domain